MTTTRRKVTVIGDTMRSTGFRDLGDRTGMELLVGDMNGGYNGLGAVRSI